MLRTSAPLIGALGVAKAMRFFFTANAFLWGILSILETLSFSSLPQTGPEGCYYRAHVVQYLYIPVAALSTAISVYVLSKLRLRSVSNVVSGCLRFILLSTQLLIFLSFFPYMFFFTGGM